MDPTIEELAQVFDLAPADADRPARFAKVTAVSGDTVTVSLGSGTADAVRCCVCVAGDVVLLETLPSGQLAAVATKGYDGGGSGSTYSLSGAVSGHKFTATLTDGGGGTSTASVGLVAGSNVTLTDSGTNITIAATDTTYSDATQSDAGLMSAADKAKLDGIESGAKATMSGSYTPAGTVSQPTFAGDSLTSTGTYTPEGSVSTPTISVKTAGTTTSVNSMTGAGTLPTLSMSVTGECLTIAFAQGTLPTSSAVTVKTGDAAYQSTQPTFAGTAKTVTVTGTPTGTVSQPTFSGTTATINVS